jgi:phosphoglycolate phosphatase
MVSATSAPLTLVFDLDGTLVDTAPDLVAATNHVLATLGRAPACEAALRPAVSHGALAMIRTGLGAQCADWPESELYPLFDTFIAHYEAHIATASRPFPGLIAALDRAAEAGHILAVCTNKQERHARQLLTALGLETRFAAITGRDTFAVYKPDPGHLTGTIALAGGLPGRAVMVGDSGTDIATARAARIPVIAVSFGYTDRPIEDFAPDIVIDHYDAFDSALKQIAF